MNKWHQRLQEAAQRRGVNQTELARACGVSPSAVSQWFSGETKNMRVENIVACAKRLNISLKWLLSGQGTMEATQDPVTQQMLEHFSRLNPEQQQELVRLAALFRASTPANQVEAS